MPNQNTGAQPAQQETTSPPLPMEQLEPMAKALKIMLNVAPVTGFLWCIIYFVFFVGAVPTFDFAASASLLLIIAALGLMVVFLLPSMLYFPALFNPFARYLTTTQGDAKPSILRLAFTAGILALCSIELFLFLITEESYPLLGFVVLVFMQLFINANAGKADKCIFDPRSIKTFIATTLGILFFAGSILFSNSMFNFVIFKHPTLNLSFLFMSTYAFIASAINILLVAYDYDFLNKSVQWPKRIRQIYSVCALYIILTLLLLFYSNTARKLILAGPFHASKTGYYHARLGLASDYVKIISSTCLEKDLEKEADRTMPQKTDGGGAQRNKNANTNGPAIPAALKVFVLTSIGDQYIVTHPGFPDTNTGMADTASKECIISIPRLQTTYIHYLP